MTKTVSRVKLIALRLRAYAFRIPYGRVRTRGVDESGCGLLPRVRVLFVRYIVGSLSYSLGYS